MTCPLTKASGCEWCGASLTGRQRRWCGRRCSRLYTANHRWTQAKKLAKAAREWYLCEHADSDGWVKEPYADVCEVWTQKPEVNHKIPCKGQHGKWGCHHHQENLEVLCRSCHLRVTAEQRAKGLI